MPDWLKDRIDNSNLILFDGTLWTDDEMIKENVGIKTGQRMGHMSMSGPEGSIEAFKNLNIKRKRTRFLDVLYLIRRMLQTTIKFMQYIF